MPLALMRTLGPIFFSSPSHIATACVGSKWPLSWPGVVQTGHCESHCPMVRADKGMAYMTRRWWSALWEQILKLQIPFQIADLRCFAQPLGAWGFSGDLRLSLIQPCPVMPRGSGGALRGPRASPVWPRGAVGTTAVFQKLPTGGFPIEGILDSSARKTHRCYTGLERRGIAEADFAAWLRRSHARASKRGAPASIS